LQAIFTASQIDIVAAAAAHQHELQHLLILTEQHVMYAFLHWKRCNCQQTFATNTPGGSASKSKVPVLMAYKCLSMSCALSEVFNVCSGCVLGEQHQYASDNPSTNSTPEPAMGGKKLGCGTKGVFTIGCSCLSRHQELNLEVRLWAHKTSLQT